MTEDPICLTEKHGKRTVTYRVNRHGSFAAYSEAGTVLASGYRLDGVQEQVRKKMKDHGTQVAVMFKVSTGHTAIARRFSLKSGYDKKILCWMDNGTPNGKRFQLATRNFGDPVAFKSDTPVAVFEALKSTRLRIHELRAEAQKLENNLREVLREYSFDLASAVQSAIEEANRTPDDDPQTS